MERGTKVMSAIHKRLHYTQKVEFNILARIFKESLSPTYPYKPAGKFAKVPASNNCLRAAVAVLVNPPIIWIRPKP